MVPLSVVQAGDEVPKKRKRRKNVDARVIIQSRVSRFMKGKLSSRWLESWFDQLTPSEQGVFIKTVAPYLFVKPVQPKDPVDTMTPEQLDQIINSVRR
jgi:hypothetical protein